MKNNGHQNKSLKGFVSYSHKDKIFTKELLSELEKDINDAQSAVSIWFDAREMYSDGADKQSPWPILSKNIDKSDFVLLVLSPESIGSSWVRKEIKFAQRKCDKSKERFFIVVALYKNCISPNWLKNKNYPIADFRFQPNRTMRNQESFLRLREALVSNLSRDRLESWGAGSFKSSKENEINSKAADMIVKSYSSSKNDKALLLDHAQAMLEYLIQQDPYFFQAHQNLGTVLYEKALCSNDIDLYLHSIRSFQIALKGINPQQKAITNYSVGRAYARLAQLESNNEEKEKNFLESIGWLNSATKRDPRFHFAYCWLGRVHKGLFEINHNQLDCEKAEHYFNKAIQIKPDYEEAIKEYEFLTKTYGDGNVLGPRNINDAPVNIDNDNHNCEEHRSYDGGQKNNRSGVRIWIETYYCSVCNIILEVREEILD